MTDELFVTFVLGMILGASAISAGYKSKQFLISVIYVEIAILISVLIFYYGTNILPRLWQGN